MTADHVKNGPHLSISLIEKPNFLFLNKLSQIVDNFYRHGPKITPS